MLYAYYGNKDVCKAPRKCNFPTPKCTDSLPTRAKSEKRTKERLRWQKKKLSTLPNYCDTYNNSCKAKTPAQEISPLESPCLPSPAKQVCPQSRMTDNYWIWVELFQFLKFPKISVWFGSQQMMRWRWKKEEKAGGWVDCSDTNQKGKIGYSHALFLYQSQSTI